MPVDFKDYYEVLGIPRNASADAIKKAFRKMARIHHPDVAKNKANGEEKFKEINEANEVLSDPAKRRKYDELGVNWNQPEQQPARRSSPAEAGQEFHFGGTGFSDFFEQVFGSRTRQSEDFGSMPRNGNGRERVARHGDDVEGDILVTLDEVLHGSTRTIELQRTDPRTGQSSTQTLRVKIPPGVCEGQIIRLAGKGKDGIGGGDSGHLYLRVVLAQHPDLRVRGATLYYELELSPWEAVLGTSVAIPTLGGTVSLKVPPGTAAQREFRLRGQGLPTDHEGRGDLHAVVNIQVPSILSSDEKVLWEQLAAGSAFNPRAI